MQWTGKQVSGNTAPYNDVISVTPGATEFDVTRGFVMGTAGTVSITTAAGNDRDDFPAVAGYNPVAIKKFRALGTATDPWLAY